ncbi:MAG: hypothetical protein HQM09_03805 [Candidatus Riflebacteria bacterium]|nr:hypothetical protein [Candidatus Riflebacteria bacterium]
MKIQVRIIAGDFKKILLMIFLLLCAVLAPISVEAANDPISDTRLIILAARRFIDLDTNEDGVLDSSERAAIISTEARRVFDTLDQNKDGVVTRLEFSKGVEGKFFPTSAMFSHIYSSFQRRFSITRASELDVGKISKVAGSVVGEKLLKTFDLNADGRLSELEGVLMEIFLVSLLKGNELSDKTDSMISQSNLSFEVSRAQRVLYLLLDADSDGKISEAEFGALSSESRIELIHELNDLYSKSNFINKATERSSIINANLAATATSKINAGTSSGNPGVASTSLVDSRIRGSGVASTSHVVSRIDNSGVTSIQRTPAKKLDYLFLSPRQKNTTTTEPSKLEWRYTIEKILW